MFMFFFFFKQKTAYEMRISDWSSDVCSSDLAPSVASKRGFQFIDQPGNDAEALRPEGRVGGVELEGREQFLVTQGAAGAQHVEILARETRFGVAEIGRASCRERGCQYV